jgi:hypothetical protein
MAEGGKDGGKAKVAVLSRQASALTPGLLSDKEKFPL